MSIAGSLRPGPPLVRSEDERPLLFVVVDTEEEFDWSAPLGRENTSVRAMRQIHRAQRVFDEYGLKPTYVVDYPIAANPDGYNPLIEIAADTRCHIGAHLHPWVNPPHEESVTPRNSFMCNLPVALQRAKLSVLCEIIATSFGTRPLVFKAGRYGLGPTAAKLLDESGFEVDNSICPRFDFSSEDGPSFDEFEPQPFFFDDTPLLEVPCTVEYVGLPAFVARPLHRLASSPTLQRLRAPGVLSRFRIVNRVMLSPEGNTFQEMRLLTRTLVRRGVRTFTMSFHSPSLEPGHTPYVHTQADLNRFLERIKQYCDFFLGDLAGAPSTLLEFRASVAPEGVDS